MVSGRLRRAALARGRSIARLLACAWHYPPVQVETSVPELETVTPYLLQSGSASLAWARIRQTPLAETPSGQKLLSAYRLHSLQKAIHEKQLADLTACFEKARVPFYLGKGWAVAREYHNPSLRPYGDFDIYVARQDHTSALAALRDPKATGIPVDLHEGLAELDDRSAGGILERSRTVPCGPHSARLFGPEDHLRLLSLHMVRHGAWRPIWLCDVAVLLERSGQELDWEYLFEGDPTRTAWVSASVLLARELLGARVHPGNLPGGRDTLPRWLAPTVLRLWGDPPIPHGLRTPMRTYLRHPLAFAKALLERWPGPIEATVGRKGSLNDVPRLPYQLAECIARIAQFASETQARRRPGTGP